MTPPVSLVIAGVDSAGGAGVHADIRTFAAHEVHAAAAITVVTAQDTLGIRAAHPIPAEMVAAQCRAVLADLRVRSIKTGMLPDVEVVDEVVAVLAGAGLPAVVDPVLVSAAGTPILDRAVADAVVERLFPVATVVTPNRAEAELLVGRALDDLGDRRRAAAELCALGPDLVVIKGGERADGDEAIDVVAGVDGRVRELRTPRIATGNDHGTGCSFASAIAAGLARGRDVDAAIDDAKRFVHGAIAGATSWELGAGHGPIDQLGWDRAR